MQRFVFFTGGGHIKMDPQGILFHFVTLFGQMVEGCKAKNWKFP